MAVGFVAATLFSLKHVQMETPIVGFRQSQDYSKGTGRVAPTIPAAALLKVVMETCTVKHMFANTRVYATCDTLTAMRAPTAIHAEAFQLHHRSPGNHMELLQ